MPTEEDSKPEGGLRGKAERKPETKVARLGAGPPLGAGPTPSRGHDPAEGAATTRVGGALALIAAKGREAWSGPNATEAGAE